MICSHCGKVLDNDKLMFCVYCGYPLKGEKQGFFAKSAETGISRAEELAADSIPEMPSIDTPVQPASAPAMQNAQQIPQKNAASQVNPVQPMGTPMGMQSMGTPMGMQQPMQTMPGNMSPVVMPGGMSSMNTMNGMNQMAYGMPQMGYGMPQMQYGMPQFAGYDPNGNPIYVQMVPQLMGYDAYGNPVYNMVAMPYVMPAMQGMPGVTPMVQPQGVYQQEQVIDVPQEQIRPAEAIPAPKQAPTVQAVPVQPMPAPQQPKMQTIPNVPPVPMAAPKPPVQQPVAPVVQPIQSVQAAAQAVQEALMGFQGVNVIHDAEPVPPTPYRSVQVNSADEIPMDADTLMHEDENGQPGNMPDEKALLDSIFSSKSQNYSMSAGTKPAAATFSINVSASEITSVRDEEFGSTSEAAPPPVQSLFSRPGVQVNPFSGPAINTVESEPEPAPVPSAAPAPAPTPKPAAKKASKPRTEEDANAAKRAAKEQKMREKEALEAKEAKAAKEAKPTKKKAQQKKAPAKIVSPDEFFEDKPHNGTRSKSMLSVKDLDKLDDDQLAAHLSSMGATTGGKKSNRSMKAASKEEMDISNIDVDALVGANKSRLPN